jgi:hypothetical protein
MASLTPILDRVVTFAGAVVTALVPILIDQHVIAQQTGVDIGIAAGAIVAAWHGSLGVQQAVANKAVTGSYSTPTPVATAAVAAPVYATQDGTAVPGGSVTPTPPAT